MKYACTSPPRVRRVVAIVLACMLVVSPAMCAIVQQTDAETLKFLHDELAKSFELSKDLPLDPALRREADEIGAAHLSRVDRLLPQWLEEERALQSADGHAHRVYELRYALWARQLNELALWQVMPGDPAYERATLAVLKSTPRICLHHALNFSEFSRRIERIGQMPMAQRSAALATERQLLSHWGQVRTEVPAWPDVPPQNDALALIKRLPAEGQRSVPALPPVLAFELLGQGTAYPALGPSIRCELQQWWLQEKLRQGAAPATVLNNFRYGNVVFASDALNGDLGARSANQAQAAASPAAYFPKFASYFGASGKTTMLVEVDTSGKALQASVANRQVTVQGIRGQRPIAFENVFDKAAVSYVLEALHFDKQARTGFVRIQIVWTLDDDAPSSTPPKKGGL